ncbi:MAG: SUMF1/EgtB/PvdO family nonheme iron enzyme [Nitrospira sp.]
MGGYFPGATRVRNRNRPTSVGARFSYSQVLAPVERYEQGRSPYGLYRMAGNVGEWVADWYGAHYYDHGPPQTHPDLMPEHFGW